MVIRDCANWETLSAKAYDNPVPSCDSDVAEGQTSRTYDLYEIMKSVGIR